MTRMMHHEYLAVLDLAVKHCRGDLARPSSDQSRAGRNLR